MHITSKSLL